MMHKMAFKDLYELIDVVKIRPPMYLGTHSISVLKQFISGYLIACDVHGVDEQLSPDFDDLEDFVNRYYQRDKSGASWCGIILAENYGDEKAALDQFFKLFELFRNGYEPIPTNIIILKLIQKLIDDPEFLVRINDNEISAYLKKLPTELEDGRQAYYDFNSTFWDIANMAERNSILSGFITDINGSDNWKKVFG